LLTNTWYDPYVVFKYGLNTSPKIYLKKYIYFLILLIITIIVSLYLCSFIEFNTILDIINKFIICIIIPNLIFLLAFYKKDEFKYFLELLNKFKMLILHYIKLIKKY
ncbi:Oligosaccharide translocase, partial [human gut metagenome]